MISLIIHCTLTMSLTILASSILTFAIIQLPPGDYLTTYIATLELSGERGASAPDHLSKVRL